MRRRLGCEGVSTRRQHLVADQAQSDTNRAWVVEIERLDRIARILTKLFPGVSLSEDGLRQTLRAVAAVDFLGDFKDQHTHTITLSLARPPRPHLDSR